MARITRLRAGSLRRGERAPLDHALPTGPIPVVTDFVCPIRGPLTFTDTWAAPRPGGRRHEGTDLMNPYGTPNVAVVSGGFETHHSGLGGLSIYFPQKEISKLYRTLDFTKKTSWQRFLERYLAGVRRRDRAHAA